MDRSMFLCFIFLCFGAQLIVAMKEAFDTNFNDLESQMSLTSQISYIRPWHIIYVQNPNETEEQQKEIMNSRAEAVKNTLNYAMDFHEIPMQFEVGKVYLQENAIWNLPKTTSCVVAIKLCRDWANGFGRETNQLDIWSCIFPNSYYRVCAGMAYSPGDVNFVGNNAFRKPRKIGILHEIGHNLGCSHQTGLCQPNFEQFAEATGKRYQTYMGGGAACPKRDLSGQEFERLRLPLYTDANKSFCEEGHCLKLGTKKFDCAGKIRQRLVKMVENLSPLRCSSGEENYLGFCLEHKQASCGSKNTVFMSGNFENTIQCANFVKNTIQCPSNVFYYRSWARQKKRCGCCVDENVFEPSYQTKTQIKRQRKKENIYIVKFETKLPSDVLRSDDSDESLIADTLIRLLSALL